MTMTYTETATYYFTEKQYKDWLETYCEDRTEVDPDDVWDSFVDSVISSGRREIEEEYNDDTRDAVIEDVTEKIDPDGKRAKLRELEAELQRVYAKKRQIEAEMRELGV